MRATVIALACLAAGAAAGTAAASPRRGAPDPPGRDGVRGAAAVVPVVTQDASGNLLKRGIGFFVTIGRLVVPRALLADRAYSARVVYGGHEQRVTAVLAEDPRAGLVLVAVDLPDGAPPALSPRPRRSGVHAGKYRVIGADGTLTQIEVAEQREIPGFGTACSFTASGSVPGGGSPVVDAEGDLAGVVVDQGSGQTRLVYVLPADRLLAMTPTGPASLADWASRPARARSVAGEVDYLKGLNAALNDRPEEATAHFRAAAGHDTSDADAQGALGAAELAAGRPTEAIAAYRRAVAADPGNAGWHHHLAVSLGDAGQWDEAVREFAAVTRIRPTDAEAHFNLGAAYGTLARYQDEYDAYQAALQQNSAHVRALHNLGIACVALKRYPEAVTAFARAIRLTPADAQLHAELGVAYYDLKQYPLAIEELRRAIELNPSFAKAHYGLAVVLAASGQREAALAECQALEHLDRARADELRRLVAAR